jgi:hypothetical protein
VAAVPTARPPSKHAGCAGVARAAALRAAMFHAEAERESVGDELGVGCAAADG